MPGTWGLHDTDHTNIGCLRPKRPVRTSGLGVWRLTWLDFPRGGLFFLTAAHFLFLLFTRSLPSMFATWTLTLALKITEN